MVLLSWLPIKTTNDINDQFYYDIILRTHYLQVKRKTSRRESESLSYRRVISLYQVVYSIQKKIMCC